METVSYTAQWTAAARALETERGDQAIFQDPYARALAAPRGFELLEKNRGSGLAPFIAIRTRYLDESIKQILAENAVRQIVFVAAGMDTRLFRLDWPDDATAYEVDFPALLEEKRRRLADLGAQPRVTRHEVAVDLRREWLPELEQAGFDRDRPTLWIAEGLLFFLTPEQATGLLRTLGSASAQGSWLGVDLVSQALLRSPFSRAFRRNLEEDGTPWLFGTDEPEEYLASAGWRTREVKEPGEPGATHDDWQFQVQPRERKGPSRSWLVRAEYAGD
ncbi:S-adenosyl-L-methionine-dependent methyltransferase [Streptomyces inusitatus]|uniref:S-adenosyl-L-methionine-dependent methyltransferase n=1 Tax=Streptomyces inusitatus TaxID=68221 RepID=A0A918QAF4_9ACTN|nr:SAM-dependent methyltransferase [Streptomyces inusitatus]GGZ39262.1 S-adenosyl-L-methionine-dependent methyltransferase [Streptomyces inusitatus]